jgi:hypothetical protein
MLDQSWRPDGQRADAYVDHGRDPERWAWEFLRRNPEYQADYARWNALPDSEDGRLSMKFDHPSWGDFDSMKYFSPADGYPALEGETFGEYEQRTGQSPEPLERVLCRKWGLVALSLGDPSKDYRDLAGAQFVIHQRHYVYAPLHLDCKWAREIFSGWIEGVRWGTKKMISANVLYDLGDENSNIARDLDTNISGPNYAIFAFDLRLDPEEQTDIVLETLRTMREKQKKQDGGIRPAIMLRRLRVLDLAACGHKQSVIANILRITDAMVSKDLKCARELVAAGYKELARVV